MKIIDGLNVHTYRFLCTHCTHAFAFLMCLCRFRQVAPMDEEGSGRKSVMDKSLLKKVRGGRFPSIYSGAWLKRIPFWLVFKLVSNPLIGLQVRSKGGSMRIFQSQEKEEKRKSKLLNKQKWQEGNESKQSNQIAYMYEHVVILAPWIFFLFFSCVFFSSFCFLFPLPC